MSEVKFNYKMIQINPFSKVTDFLSIFNNTLKENQIQYKFQEQDFQMENDKWHCLLRIDSLQEDEILLIIQNLKIQNFQVVIIPLLAQEEYDKFCNYFYTFTLYLKNSSNNQEQLVNDQQEQTNNMDQQLQDNQQNQMEKYNQQEEGKKQQNQQDQIKQEQISINQSNQTEEQKIYHESNQNNNENDDDDNTFKLSNYDVQQIIKSQVKYAYLKINSINKKQAKGQILLQEKFKSNLIKLNEYELKFDNQMCDNFIGQKIHSSALINRWQCKGCNSWNIYQHFNCRYCSNDKLSPGRMNKQGKHEFDYLFVMDYECNNYGARQEIIEFPIVVLDVKQNKIVGTFQRYVKPLKLKKLNLRIIELTGISQEQIDKSNNLFTVVNQAMDFISSFKGKCAILYDCNSDFNFISEEIQQKKLKIKNIFRSFINLRNIFPLQFDNWYPDSFKKMLNYLNIEMTGNHHSGIDDATNICKIAQYLISEGYKFKNNFNINPNNPFKLNIDTIIVLQMFVDINCVKSINNPFKYKLDVYQINKKDPINVHDQGKAKNLKELFKNILKNDFLMYEKTQFICNKDLKSHKQILKKFNFPQCFRYCIVINEHEIQNIDLKSQEYYFQQNIKLF